MSSRIITEAEALKMFNDRYFMTHFRGKFVIMEEKKNPATGRLELVPSSSRDFREFYSHIKIQEGKNLTSAAVHWIEHEEARRYRDVIFDPSPTRRDLADDSIFNTWKGFATFPIVGGWPLIEKHFREVLACGDDDLYNFILDWFAWLVQRPHIPPGICLAFQGVPGAGKTTIGKICELLVGTQHYLPVSHASQLVGRFNGHLEDRVLLFADEAFWAGDKQGEAVLKTLITEPTLTIENKFGRIERVRNCVHLIMATNSDWVAPIGKRDRRYVVMQTSNRYADSAEYFDPLYEEIGGLGLNAFMYDMLKRPLPSRLRKPQSYVAAYAGNEQTRHSFDDFMQWLDGRLMAGVIARAHTTSGGDWPEVIEKAHVYNDYLHELKDTGRRHIMNEARFSRRLLQELPILTDRRLSSPGRPRAWVLPPLEQCRQHIENEWHTLGFYATAERERADDEPEPMSLLRN